MKRDRMAVTPERVTFAAVAAVLLALAGAIAYLGLQERDPANVTVEQVGEVRLEGTQAYVTGEVRNSGDQTAEAVQVVAEVTVDGQVVSTGEQLIDFLSGGETELIVFIFDQPSLESDPKLRVAGYKVP